MALVRVIGFALVVLTRQPCWWLEAAVREARSLWDHLVVVVVDKFAK
jgi:hypothetical protein